MFKRPSKIYDVKFRSRDASRTRQEFLKDSLITTIMARFKATGEIDFPNADRPTIVGDELPNDFTEGMNNVTFNTLNGVKENDDSGTTSTQSSSEGLDSTVLAGVSPKTVPES